MDTLAERFVYFILSFFDVILIGLVFRNFFFINQWKNKKKKADY